jgi:hypothetical protein
VVLNTSTLAPLLWHDALLLLVSQPARELSAPDLERELSLRQYQVSRLVEGLADWLRDAVYPWPAGPP